MVVQVRKVGDEFVIPPQAAHELGLVDGASVEVSAVVSEERQFRYATVEEAMHIFEKTLPKHEAVYRELAK